MASSGGNGTAIGIDLGTMYSRVAVWRNGEVEIICNENGDQMTPSCVAFTDSERLVGEDAKNQVAVNQENTIFAAKRILGIEFSSQLRAFSWFWPFAATISAAESEPPKIAVNFKGEVKRCSPEEICAMMLAKMKEIAEDHLGSTVKDAVIAIPSFFNQSQRQATIDAATIAGLNVLRLINDPTAAALTYELRKSFVDVEENKSILVYCVGAGNTSVSVININCGTSFEVKSTTGSINLGGEDFDNCVVTYLMDEFERKFKKNLSSNSTAKMRLKIAAEKAKKTLSSRRDATIVLDALQDGINFTVTISRARLEDLCIGLFRSTLKLVEQALKDAKVETSDIHDVVLVGGSTRIPKIQQLLQDFFNGKELHTSTNLDESVVYGAAVQAAILARDTNERIPKLNIKDVAPMKIGTFDDDDDDAFEMFFERNTKIPCSKTSEMTTVKDNQDFVNVSLFEIDLSDRTDDEFGYVTVENIPPAPAQEPEIEVSFDIDANGILRVFRIGGQGAREHLPIKNDGGRLTREEVKRLSTEAANNKVQDDNRRKQIIARNRFEKYITDVKHGAEEWFAKSTTECEDAIKWFNDNKEASEKEFTARMIEVQKKLKPLMVKSCKLWAGVDGSSDQLLTQIQKGGDKPGTSTGNDGPPNKKRRNN